jgi:hypothetical protein
VLDQIANIDCDFGPGGERSQPKERVEIRRIELRPRQAQARPPRMEASEMSIPFSELQNVCSRAKASRS